MSGSFDAYHAWLGISPRDRPPNHYRLLGIEPFESDEKVIEHAADRQMAHVRKFQTGTHAALSQKILNEISAARITLLDPGKKTRYDGRLRGQLDIVRSTANARPMKPTALSGSCLLQPL